MENYVKATPRRRNQHYSLNTISASNQGKCHNAKRCSSSTSKQPPTLNNSKLSTLPLQAWKTHGDTEFKNHQYLMKSVHQNTSKKLVKEQGKMTKPGDPIYHSSQNDVRKVKNGSQSNFWNLHSTLTLSDVECGSEEITKPQSSSSSIYSIDSSTRNSVLSNPVGYQLPANVYEEVYYQMKQLQHLTHHVEKLGKMIETVEWKHCDMHSKLLQEKETEIQERKVLLNRQKHELRQQWKTQENEVQLYGTRQTDDAPLLQAQLLKTTTMQAEVSEAHQKNDHLQAAIEEFQCINEQFSSTNVDVDAQLHDFKTKNINLQEMHARKQPTVAVLTKINYKYWSQMSKVQESIINLKTAIDEVKEDNSKLQSMISELHLKHEQIHPISMELQGNVHPMDAFVKNKLCNKVDARNEDQELHLRVLKLHEQNNQLKTMIMDLDKKQSCQETLYSQIQDSISQLQDIMEKLQKGNKQMQATISEFDEKKYQFDDLASELQRNIVKLQTAIPHCVQLCAFSELQNMKEENSKLQFENWELQAKISELCKSKHSFEISLSALKARVFHLEANKSDNEKLQYRVFNLEDKSNEYINTIIKLECENIILQKKCSDLQGYKKQLLTIISELQSKALKLEGIELQNKQLQFFITDLLRRNAELNIKINEFAEKNNSLEEYLLQVQQNVTHHQITNVDLQGYTRPQIRIAEASGSKYQFEASSSELQTVLDILEVTGTMKEKLQVSISKHQEHILEAQDNILKLHRSINSLHQLIIELQKYSQQLSLNVSEFQDKICMSDIRKAQNQCVPVICQGKKSYNEGIICTPELETMLESPFTRLPTSTENSLIRIVLKVIKVSKDIELSIEKMGIETKRLQASFFDLEAKIIKMQLHNDGLLNSEEGTLQEIVQQLKEHKHTLEKHEDEKALLKHKIFELDERLAKEKSFSNKVEAQIQKRQQAANSEIKKLQKSLKDLLSNNTKLEKTINWSLECNGALGVKLDTLKNILIEEQVQFSEKEIKLSYQWQMYMNQIECLQGTLSEMVTENTDLKETVKILDQEKAHLQTTVSELQSKLKSEKLNIKIQQDDELHAKSSSSRQYEKSKTMEKNIKLTRSMEEFEGVWKHPGNTMDKLKTKLTEESLSFDKKGSQIKSEEKATDRDGNSCPEAIIEELVDRLDKDSEMHVTIEKAESMVDHINSEINMPLTDEILFCMGSETSDMPNQSILDVLNSHMLKMANELMEYNKQLKAYIGNLMEEKYLLTAMVSELKKNVTKLQQQVDRSELQMINTLCKDIPTIIDPVESENKQLFNHKNVLDNIVNKLEKKTSRDKFNCSGPAVQMEIQKDAENNQLKNKVKDLLKKNEDLKMSIKKHENEKKLLETILIEKENILSVGQKNVCEIQSQMKYKIQLLENQKCQVENMVNDLLDGSITLAVNVDKMLLQLTEDEMDSDLKKQHDFSELQTKIVEPEGKMCEIIEVQDEAKKLEEAKRQYKLIEKYGVEKECLTKSLLKFKLLLKNQQIYCRTSADLTSEIKEANTKIQQLQEKLNALTYNSSKLQEIDDKSREESQISNIFNSEGQGSKSLSMEPEHLRWNITSSNYTGQHPKNYLEDRKYLKSYVQPPEETNGSKILNLQNIKQLEAIKELQDSSEEIQNAMEKTEREKKMLELNETLHIERLDTEQYTSNKLTVYLKNKCKILANRNNYLQDTITELLNDITAFQVLIDNLEQERKLLVTKVTELNDEMKVNKRRCNEKAKQGNLPKTTDLQNNLKGPENINTNLQAATAEVDRDKMPPAIIITNFNKNNECQTSQPTGIEIDSHHLIETDDELQDSETRCQQTIDNIENSRILLIETTSNLQDKILEEHNVSIALLKNSQIYSENAYQQKLKKNPPENPHLHNEEKVKFIASEPKEEKMTLNKILFQPEGQEDFTWTVREREIMDVALENLSGEASIPEVSTFSLESPISENQQCVHELKRTITESEIINEAINNFQGRNQQAMEKNFSTSAHLCIVDEEDLYTVKTNCQCDISYNCTEPEVGHTWLQETTESINNIGDLKMGNIMMKKETLLAGDSKLQHKVSAELGDTEKPTSICANVAPVLYYCQQEKCVTLSKRIQEPNGVTLNHQGDEDFLKVTLNDQETELSEEEFKNKDYIDQSLSIKPMAVFTDFKKPTSSDSEQITGNSEPQKVNKTVEAAGTDLAHKMESTLIEEDINSLNSITSEEITAQEMLEKENNKSTPSLWMKCIMQ